MCRSMLSACTMALMGLVVLLLVLQNCRASDIVACPTFWYLSDGKCYRCPDNCSVCVSNTNCTLCQRGFYGPVCENRCEEGCSGTCHKLFGHCTYGCPDGDYPEEGNGCEKCPLRCSVCESQSKCVLCEAEHFGVSCQERCPEQCTTCNKTTGKCLQCRDSYFIVNGLCKSCPQGCKVCVSLNTCTECNDAYFKHDGLCMSCPYGCILCNTTDNCHSCEEGFHGPVDGRCIFDCPVNGVMPYFLPNKYGRCGLWQDTDHNICDGQSKSSSCTSSGNCLQDVGQGNLSDACVDSMNVPARCGHVMQYKCKHECAWVASRYVCEETCTVRALSSANTSIFFLENNALTVSQTFQTHFDCNQEEEDTSRMSETVFGAGHDSNTITYGITIALLAIIVIALVVGIVMLYRKIRQRNQTAEKPDQTVILSKLLHTADSQLVGVEGTSLGGRCATTTTIDRGYGGSKVRLPETGRLLETELERRLSISNPSVYGLSKALDANNVKGSRSCNQIA